MSKFIVSETSTYEPIPPGWQDAVCASVIDLGTQETPWGEKHEIYFGFELPGVTVDFTEDGKTRTVRRQKGAFFKLTLNSKSALRPFLEDWRGRPFTKDELKGFDLENVLGAPCRLKIANKEENGKVSDKITAVDSWSGELKPQLESDKLFFCLAGLDKPEMPEAMPEWFAERIRQSPEWQTLENPPAPAVAPEEKFDIEKPEEEHIEIPF